MTPTYTKLQIEADGQTNLLQQADDQTMVAKQGKTSFAIRRQDGTASTAVEQKWHMISAEKVGEGGSVIWQNAKTGDLRETKYNIDEDKKTWTQTGKPQEISISELYKLEGQHKQDLNQDGFVSSEKLNLDGPGELKNGKSELLIGGSTSTEKNALIGRWRADRNSQYTITGKDAGLFEIDQSGTVKIKNAEGLTPEKSYEIEITASDATTGQKISQQVSISKRALIMVTNDKGDNSEGSIGSAIKQSNINGAKGIASEIQFSKSMTIKQTDALQLLEGNTTINTTNPKNIAITRTDNGPCFIIGEFKYANQNNVDTQPDLKTALNQISIFNSTAKGGDAQAEGGSSGGPGAGSALLHFNGHVDLNNTLTQGNTVIGGEGALAPKAGAGLHAEYKKTGSRIGIRRYGKAIGPQDGGEGKPGGTLNGRTHSMSGQTNEGGKAGITHDGKWSLKQRLHYGRPGRDGIATKNIGEGPMGASAPGGGTHAHKDDFFMNNYPGARGHGGEGGKPASGGWGSGEAVKANGGGSSWNASQAGPNMKKWNHAIYWKTYPANRANPGQWGGSAQIVNPAMSEKQAINQYKNGAIPFENRSRGGSGAAAGAIASLAQNNSKNSITLNRHDSIGNQAKSSASAGKFKNIYLKHNHAVINNVRESDNINAPDSSRDPLEPGSYNIDPTKTDKSKIHNNSGTFIQGKAKATPYIIQFNSYEVKEAQASITGKTIRLDPQRKHIIFWGAENNQANFQSPKILNWEKFKTSTQTLVDRVYKTKTEQEIKASHKGILGAKDAKGVFNALNKTNYGVTPLIVKTAGQKGVQAGTEAYNKHMASKLESLTKQFGEAKAKTEFAKYTKNLKYGGLAVGVTAGVADLVITQMQEDKRIEKELKERQETIDEKKSIAAGFKAELKNEYIQINHNRTTPEATEYSINNHPIKFQPGLDPVLRWEPKSLTNGAGTVSILQRDLKNRNDIASAKVFGRLKFDSDFTKGMQNITDKSAYLNSFITYQEVNGAKIAVLSSKSEWKVKENATQDPQTGPGADRIEIKRDYTKVTDQTNLVIHTHQGDDSVIGDQGNSTIKLGRGNDYAQPGLGSNVVDGGEGKDTVSYQDIDQPLKIRAQKDGSLQVSFAKPNGKQIKNDTITNTENFIVKEDADIDLAGIAQPTNYSTTDPARTTNIENKIFFAIGQGSTLKGSQYDDVTRIDFTSASKNNLSPESARVVTVDGREGRNSLFVSGLDKWTSQGWQVSNDKEKGEIKLTKGQSEKTIVSYQNYMGDPRILPKQSEESKAKTPTSSTMDTAEEFDVLTNYANQRSGDHSLASKSLNNDLLVLQNNHSHFGLSSDNLILEPSIQGISSAQDPINLILGGTSNNLDNDSTKHQQRDPLTQERMDNF